MGYVPEAGCFRHIVGSWEMVSLLSTLQNEKSKWLQKILLCKKAINMIVFSRDFTQEYEVWCFFLQLINRVRLFATPWTTAHHTPLSFLISWNLLNSYSFGASQGVLSVKNLPANAGGMKCRFDPGRSLGEGNDNPLQCSCLGNPVDKAAWRATVTSLMSDSLQFSTQAHVQWISDTSNHPILCHPLLFINNGPMVKSLLPGAHEMTLPSMIWAEGCTQETNLFATELSLCCWPVHMFIISHFHSVFLIMWAITGQTI